MTQENKRYVVGEKFTRAWINLEKFPGSMMRANGEPSGPVPASTSCFITTSEREAERLRAKGPILEIFTREPNPALTQAERDELELIIRSDPSFVIQHLKYNTAYNVKLIEKMFELAKERAAKLMVETEEPKEWIKNLRQEVMLSKMTHNFTFSRDEVIELLGGNLALLG